MTGRPWLGCVADDYTGGTDVAAGLRRSGLSTALLFGVPGPSTAIPDCAALVVALKTRTAPAAEAVAQSVASVRRLADAGAQRFYVKYCSTFDSTAEGNIGPVVDAVLDELGEDQTLLCPASPEHGRSVFHGHLFVGDRLLSESSMRTHPLTPMTDSDLRRVLASQTPHPVGLLGHDALAAGPDAARRTLADLRGSGVRHVVADAVDEADLEVLGAAAQGLRVVTGGAGLARALAGTRRAGSAESRPARSVVPTGLPSGPSVIVAGSCSAATLDQVARARAEFPSYRVTPATSDDPEEIWRGIRAWLNGHVGGGPALVYASATTEERAATQRVFGEKTVEILEGLLARAADHAVALGARRVVVAGGETSGAVVQALGITSVVVGEEADRGVPWCLTSGPDPIRLLLKSGNFGAPDLLVRAVNTP
ncbi:3-oxo-tetronate kinase [Streptomyces sp. NPDC005263]|uniref:3-oxo-tetronate kinase n=1 Tax=Streptomyces sp. NPDC005263 TaxID=3364711 RepID=UPI0036CEDE23